MKVTNKYNKYMSIMYDKTANIYGYKNEVDEELNTSKVKDELKEELKCNVVYTSKEAILKTFGLDFDVNLYLTCEKTIATEGDFIEYLNNLYTVLGVIKYDTHTKVFCKSL